MRQGRGEPRARGQLGSLAEGAAGLPQAGPLQNRVGDF